MTEEPASSKAGSVIRKTPFLACQRWLPVENCPRPRVLTICPCMTPSPSPAPAHHEMAGPIWELLELQTPGPAEQTPVKVWAPPTEGNPPPLRLQLYNVGSAGLSACHFCLPATATTCMHALGGMDARRRFLSRVGSTVAAAELARKRLRRLGILLIQTRFMSPLAPPLCSLARSLTHLGIANWARAWNPWALLSSVRVRPFPSHLLLIRRLSMCPRQRIVCHLTPSVP